MARQIILDTETTGLEPSEGHRIIEIGAIEMINRKITNNHFHRYINPEREIDLGALNVHGLTEEFLKDKPLFSHMAEEFINFIKDAELIIHNAKFDVGFIDHELKLYNAKLGKTTDYCKIIDTLSLARSRHPGQKNNLDALCKRYNIDNTKRNLHGALLDAQLLAQVYLAMTGGQGSLFKEESELFDSSKKRIKVTDRLDLLVIKATPEEEILHQRRMEEVEKIAGN
jgi:DNA polymerase-3 subunit epsilon